MGDSDAINGECKLGELVREPPQGSVIGDAASTQRSYLL
jgi:hypothetical protein